MIKFLKVSLILLCNTFLLSSCMKEVEGYDTFATITLNGEVYLKSATKPLKVLIAFTRPLITEFADNLNLKHPLLPTISPYPTM